MQRRIREAGAVEDDGGGKAKIRSPDKLEAKGDSCPAARPPIIPTRPYPYPISRVSPPLTLYCEPLGSQDRP